MGQKERLVVFKITVLWIMLIGLWWPVSVVHAHPVDMYAQNQSIGMSRAGLRVHWKITPGPLLADSVWAAADQNQDGLIDSQEAQAWCVAALPQWVVRLDGQILETASVEDIHWPASLDAFRTGEDSIEMQMFFAWSTTLQGKHALAIHNLFQEANSLNWFSLSTEEAFSFGEPSQTNGQLQMDVYFPGGTGLDVGTQLLTSWDSGKPDISAFSDTVSQMAVNLAGTSQPSGQGSGPTGPASALAGLVRTQEFSVWFFVGALLLSLVLGSLHALTPGHGKALVAAYLVGSQGRVRDAVFLGLIVTLTHTGSVLILGFITLLASHYILPALIVPWLEIISGLLVILFGVNLFFQRGARVFPVLKIGPTKNAAPKLHALKSGIQISLAQARVTDTPSKRFYSKPGDLEHGHSHDPSGHGHVHALPANQVTWKSLLTLGVSGGLVPCPDAIAILLVAVVVNRILFGLALIMAFSVGLAFVLIAIGIAMVQGLRVMGRNDLFNRFSVYTPVVSAVAVFGLGIGLTFNAVNSLRQVSDVVSPNQAAIFPGIASRQSLPDQTPQAALSAATFDLRQAKLVYLAPDGKRQNQLSVLPLSGGDPLAYTHETSGVAGYSLSPDRKTILYTLIETNGASSLWAIGADGTGKRQILDCPHAQCVGPVWYPGGEKLVYERLNYSENASLAVFSLWWLDLATGTTKPVFQDQGFPSFAAGFSADGRWLSYTSPLNNSIQLYDLKEGRHISIVLKPGYQPRIQQAWNPTGNVLLFWEPASQDQSSKLHVKIYDLNSAHKTDPAGSSDQTELEASWSPDGKWIAIVQEATAAGGTSHQQIWLVRADGSDGHPVVDEEQVSYSDLAWSPDGRFLAYGRYSNHNSGTPEIWLADLQAGKTSRIVSNGILPALLP